MEEKTSIASWPLYLLAVLASLAAMKAASSIIGPTILAVVIAAGVSPLQDWLMRKGLPFGWAFLLTVLAVIAFVGGVALLLWVSIAQFQSVLPQYAPQIAATKAQIVDALGKRGVTPEQVQSLAKTSPDAIVKAASAVASWAAGFASALALALLLAAFLLLEAPRFPKRLASVTNAEGSDRVMVFAGDMRKWVQITTLVNFLVAVGNTIVLYLLGIQFALLWGLLSFLLGFIPSIGFIISLIPPAILALLQYGPEKALLVIVFYIVVNGAVSNIVFPRLMGKGLDLSPFIVMLSLVFWTYVLGPAGAVLSIALTMMLRLVLDSSPETRQISYLMAGSEVAEADETT